MIATPNERPELADSERSNDSTPGSPHYDSRQQRSAGYDKPYSRVQPPMKTV